jgi:hypothetical protein
MVSADGGPKTAHDDFLVVSLDILRGFDLEGDSESQIPYLNSAMFLDCSFYVVGGEIAEPWGMLLIEERARA